MLTKKLVYEKNSCFPYYGVALFGRCVMWRWKYQYRH